LYESRRVLTLTLKFIFSNISN